VKGPRDSLEGKKSLWVATDEVTEFLTIHDYHSQMDGTPAG
jgi:hypothetical protein